MAEKITSGKVEPGLKTAVVDPRVSHDAGKADWWLPVKPGTDLVLALGIMGWMFDNDRYDAGCPDESEQDPTTGGRSAHR